MAIQNLKFCENLCSIVFFWFLGACFVSFITFSLSVLVQLIVWDDSK